MSETEGSEVTFSEVTTTLSQLLDDACDFLRKATQVSKMFQKSGTKRCPVMEKLIQKQALANAKVQQAVQELYSCVEILQKKMEDQLESAMLTKENLLSKEYERIMESMKHVVTDCNRIEQLLEHGQNNPEKVLREAPSIIGHLQATMRFKPDESVHDLTQFDYVAIDSKANWNPAKFGYVKTCRVDPSDVRLPNCLNRAFVNIEEIILIQVANCHVPLAQRYLGISVMSPSGKALRYVVADEENGCYTVRYTPEELGAHELSVTFYGVHIPYSPFTIHATEMTSETESSAGSRDDRADGPMKQSSSDVAMEEPASTEPTQTTVRTATPAKKKVNPIFLKHMTNFISDQPPPRQNKDVEVPETNFNKRQNLNTDRQRNYSSGWRQQGRPVESDSDEGAGDGQHSNRQYKRRDGWNIDAKSWRSRPSGDTNQNMEEKDEAIKESKEAVDPVPVEIVPESPAQEDIVAPKQEPLPIPLDTDFTEDPNLPENTGMSHHGIIIQPPYCNLDENRNIKSKFLVSPTAFARMPATTTSSVVNDNEDNDLVNISQDTSGPPTLLGSDSLDSSLSSIDARKALGPLNVQRDGMDTDSDGEGEKKKVSDRLTLGIKKLKMEEEKMDIPSEGTTDMECDSNRGVEEVCVNESQKPEFDNCNREPRLRPTGILPTTVPVCLSQSPKKDSPKSFSFDLKSNTFEPKSFNFEQNTAVETAPVATETRSIPVCINNNVVSSNMQQSGFIGQQPPFVSTSPLSRGTDKIVSYTHAGRYNQGVQTELLVKLGSGNRKPDNTDPDSITFPIGVTENRATGHILACSTRANIVRAFDLDGKVKYTVGADGLVKFDQPSAVVCDQLGNVYVKDNVCVQAFSPQGQWLRTYGHGLLRRPYGLVMINNQLMTIDERLRAVVAFDPNSSDPVSQCPYQPLLGAGRKSKLRFASSYRDSLIACDLGAHQIYVTDSCGNLLQQFGSFGHNFGQFDNPAGITTDPYGNMLIADRRNAAIQIFDPNGQYSGYVELSTGLARPSDIHLGCNDKLICADITRHSVLVYKLV